MHNSLSHPYLLLSTFLFQTAGCQLHESFWSKEKRDVQIVRIRTKLILTHKSFWMIQRHFYEIKHEPFVLTSTQKPRYQFSTTHFTFLPPLSHSGPTFEKGAQQVFHSMVIDVKWEKGSKGVRRITKKYTFSVSYNIKWWMTVRALRKLLKKDTIRRQSTSS